MTNQLEMIEKFKPYIERQSPGRRTATDYVSDVRRFVLKPGGR
jgi:hypothetical protein